MGVLKDLGIDWDGKAVSSALRVNAGSDRLLKLKHKHPSNGLALDLQAKQWGATYDLHSKDITFDMTCKTRMGPLRISQRIPKHQLFLIPSPVVKLTATPVDGDNKYKLRTVWEVSHDFQKKVTSLAEEVTHAGKYKARLAMDSTTGSKGATLTLTAAVSHPWATSLGMSYSASAGPVLKYQGMLGSKGGTGLQAVMPMKVLADVRLKNKDIKLEVMPGKLGRMGLSLSAALRTDKLTVPSWQLGTTVSL